MNQIKYGGLGALLIVAIIWSNREPSLLDSKILRQIPGQNTQQIAVAANHSPAQKPLAVESPDPKESISVEQRERLIAALGKRQAAIESSFDKIESLIANSSGLVKAQPQQGLPRLPR